MIEFTIHGRFPSANDYIGACRRNPHIGAKMADDSVTMVMWAIKYAHITRTAKPKCRLSITWVEPNNKRDGDNVAFAKKWILDGIVRLGILPDDSRKYIDRYDDTVVTGEKAKVIVRLYEDEKG